MGRGSWYGLRSSWFGSCQGSKLLGIWDWLHHYVRWMINDTLADWRFTWWVDILFCWGSCAVFHLVRCKWIVVSILFLIVYLFSDRHADVNMPVIKRQFGVVEILLSNWMACMLSVQVQVNSERSYQGKKEKSNSRKLQASDISINDGRWVYQNFSPSWVTSSEIPILVGKPHALAIERIVKFLLYPASRRDARERHCRV